MSQQGLPRLNPRPSRNASEKRARAEIERAAVLYAQRYPNIWVPWEQFAVQARSFVADQIGKVTSASILRNGSIRTFFWLAWILGGSFVGVLVVLFRSIAEENGQSAGWTFLAFVLAFLWFLMMALWLQARERREAELKQWLGEVGYLTAAKTMVARQDAARAYQPGVSAASLGRAPLPQPYGVSHEGAEQLVAQWMRHLGERDAEVTRFTGDGGIDVASEHYIVQVKNYTGTVGVAEVRELGGVASVDGRKPLFFTSGTFAAGAVDFANRAGIALFVYDAVQGTLVAGDGIARQALEHGL